MMYWGNGMGGWGIVLMTVSSLLFWVLVVAGIAAPWGRHLAQFPGKNKW